jgi:sugar phosphate isomerase/epimerase
MKLGVFTVSMPDYEPLEALEVLAELGYDGVEWRVTPDQGDRTKPTFWSGNRTSMTAADVIARAGELKARAKSLKLQMPALGAYIVSGFHDLASIEEHFRAAAAIGARHVRVSPGGYDFKRGDYARQVKEARTRYAKLAKLAAKHGVRSLIETHMGQLGPSISKARTILEGLDPKHVGIMWDPGNQIVEGGETYAMAIDIAGEYLGEIHAKNMKFVQKETVNGQVTWQAVPVPVREGMVNWPEVIAALKKAGYRGWIHFEDFSTEHPLQERLRDNLMWFRELLARQAQ